MTNYYRSQYRRLFYRSRLQLAVMYAGVMGIILLLCSCVAHQVLSKSFSRMIDRELEVFGQLITYQLRNQVKNPEALGWQDILMSANLCFPGQPCLVGSQKSLLKELIKDGYYVRFLSLSGKAIAGIYENPEKFPNNLSLSYSYDALDQQNELYHLHMLALATTDGRLWGYLQVGMSIRQIRRYMVSLYWLISIGVPLLIILIGWIAWYLAGWALKPIQVTYDLMENFTTDAAHELCTPIATSQAILEVALSPQIQEFSLEERVLNQQQSLEAVRRQIKRLRSLTQDLLLLSRLEAAAMAILKEQICLNEILEDVTEELMNLACKRGVNLSFNACDSLIYICGNSQQIYRLFLNLVSNGIQYTPSGGMVVIELQGVTHQAQAVVKVRDTGVGISVEHLPYLFERFYRVNHDRSRNTGGSGLGLAISLAITNLHHGKLTVQSTLNEGSEFEVTLPVISSQP
ncbi:MAG: two-component sensor histidine kinase [Oscillatoriales cyanobacterium]|nr:MAG: two-component sensor histidine kinase [Oscillatoriales cyanobacterium]